MSHDIKYFILKKYNSNIFDYLKTTNDLFQLIDSKFIFSELQIKEAIRKTERYMEHSRKINFPGTVLLMYLANTNQINAAINKYGITDKTRRGIVVYTNYHDLNFFVNNAYLKIINRFIPEDLPDHDFEVFSKMAKVDTMI
jgi:tRNA threonylcarbamoyladenosine modification (KEOPS) complex Cgi121 subunit